MVASSPRLKTALEKILWHQLQEANKQITFLTEKLGNVLDHQFFNPVIAPRTDIETSAGSEDFLLNLSDSAQFDPIADETEVKKQDELSKRLTEEFETISREQDEAHAEAT